MKRVPIWVALVPLLLGLGAYWLYWNGEAQAFRAAVATLVPEAPTPEIGGFPYRIEARLPALSWGYRADGVTASLETGQVVVNRQPWRTGHAVIAAENPRLLFALPGLPTALLSIEGASALASVRRPDAIIERLSMHFETANVRLPLVAGVFAAKGLELHFRETPGNAPAGKSPAYPAQAELRLLGEINRSGGPHFMIEVPISVTARAPLATVSAWRDGGTVNVEGARLLAVDGSAIAGIDATIAPLPDGRLAISGTVDTDCPETIRALFEGVRAGKEYRSRRSVRMAISGFAGDAIALGAPQGPRGGPARSQAPPCPALHQ